MAQSAASLAVGWLAGKAAHQIGGAFPGSGVKPLETRKRIVVGNTVGGHWQAGEGRPDQDWGFRIQTGAGRVWKQGNGRMKKENVRQHNAKARRVIGQGTLVRILRHGRAARSRATAADWRKKCRQEGRREHRRGRRASHGECWLADGQGGGQETGAHSLAQSRGVR